MAKVSFKIPKGLDSRISKSINDEIQKDEFLTLVGNIVETDIRLNLNKGVNPGTKQPFKPLAKSTIESRKQLEQYNDTSKGYGPAKSNITFTGQFIKSITHKIISTAGRKILEIAPRGIHAGYKSSTGKRSKSIQNTELANHLKDGGRNWFGFSDNVLKTIKVQLKTRLRRLLRQPIDK